MFWVPRIPYSTEGRERFSMGLVLIAIFIFVVDSAVAATQILNFKGLLFTKFGNEKLNVRAFSK